ncbi:MAG: hypothetical protein KC438_16100, partial [Thermomicrobiales bacterium]|nr:hypothetical protein [Thermomicrobiales bacterium]
DQAAPVTVGNAQLQADTLGLTLPFDLDDEEALYAWIQAMFTLTLPGPIATNALRPDFTLNTGFDITQIQSGAEIGEPPNMLTYLRGTFIPEAIETAQQLNGYQPVDINGHRVMSLAPDAAIDLANPVQAMALARLNNATFLDDGTLVYASTLGLMETALSASQTLADIPQLQRAMATLDAPLMSSMVLGPGNFLPGIPMELFQPDSQEDIAGVMLTMQAQEPAPVVLAAIAGSTAGGPVSLIEPPEGSTPDPVALASQPRSVSKFALVYATPEDAQTAAQQIESRLSTGSSSTSDRPWSEMFASWSAVPDAEQSSVLLTIEWIDRPAMTQRLVFSRDLGFITG